MIALFKAQKSVIHLASLFFLGIINEPLIHLLLVPRSKTPILNNFNNSFLNKFNCVIGTVYGRTALGGFVGLISRDTVVGLDLKIPSNN